MHIIITMSFLNFMNSGTLLCLMSADLELIKVMHRLVIKTYFIQGKWSSTNPISFLSPKMRSVTCTLCTGYSDTATKPSHYLLHMMSFPFFYIANLSSLNSKDWNHVFLKLLYIPPGLSGLSRHFHRWSF